MADDEAEVQAGRFTERELAAAEQLIHLSESSCSSYGAGALPRGSVASASSTSSPRSVNAPLVTPAPPPAAAPPAAGLLAAGGVVVAAEDDDEDQQEVGGRRRRNKRYRPIAEIYAATEPRLIRAAGAARRSRKADRPSTAAAAPEAGGK